MPIAACWPGRALRRSSTCPGCAWGGLGVLTGLRFRTGGGAPTGNTRSGVSAGHTLSRRSTRPGCDWGWLGVLTGLRFRTGGGAPTGNTRSGVSAGRALNGRSTRLGCEGGWLGVLTGLRFAPGAVLLQGIPIAACWPGHALNRRSTRPGCDWGWLGVLAGLRFAPGRCSYRKPAHGEPRCLSGLVGEWEVNLDGEAAEGAFLELEVAVVYLDQVADDIQPEAMPGNSLIQADPALQYPLPIGFADSRAIILDTQQ